MPRHFLKLFDLTVQDAALLLDRAKVHKSGGFVCNALESKVVALLFEKASTRTRVSFEVAVAHLGGRALFMASSETQLGRSEPLKDTARVLSRYVQALVVRTFAQENLEELARYGDIPVVNALSDMFHPCQVLSDVLTMAERRSELSENVVAWIGDGNNMANSWIAAAALFPFELRLACPEGFDPNDEVLRQAKERGTKVTLLRDPHEAVQGAHFINTDVWASMGQESEQQRRAEIFAPYQVDAKLMAAATEGAFFMHCLPAHRGEEVTPDVMESKASIVWDQAENRLHTQKAVLEWLFC